LAVCFSIFVAVYIISCDKSDQSTPVLKLKNSPGPDYYSLFNGTNFTGWNIEPDKGAWTVEEGAMHCKGKPRTPYLIRTEKDYENFDFYAEFKVSKGCNSGIFYHIPLAGRESRLGFESQILDDHGKKPDKNSTGSIYDVVPPLTNAMRRSGKWNQYRVLFDWPVCKIWLNGKLVQDTDFTAYPKLKYRLLSGPVGLSNHGHEVDYRNLWIQELPDKEQWTNLFNGEDLTGWVSVGDADWHVENGTITATKGKGYLVTNEEFEHFQFHAYAENDTLQSGGGCFYYRWKSADDPGYRADLFNYTDAVKYTAKYKGKIPANVTPPLKYPWLLYQIISTDRESQIRINGDVTSSNQLLGNVRAGKIALYHAHGAGVLRFQQVKIKKLEGMGI